MTEKGSSSSKFKCERLEFVHSVVNIYFNLIFCNKIIFTSKREETETLFDGISRQNLKE